VLSCGRVDLLTVGEAFHDLIFAGLERLPRPGEELRVPAFTTAAGGGAVITAVAAARLGLSAAILTAIGSDAAAELRRERIRLFDLRRPTEPGAVTVALSLPRERSFVTYDGVNSAIEPRLIRALQARHLRARHVHFALSPRTCRRWLAVVRRIQQRGATTSWDFGWNEQLRKDPSLPALMNAVDWLFLNEQEARIYSGTRSASAARRHWMGRAGGTVIKRGARGAMVLYQKREVDHEGMRARVVDTTGAGDAFNGGFLAAVVRGGRIVHALSVGTFVGARSTEALGGIAGLPRMADLPRHLQPHVRGT
jgi:sugar/nucleoside kinase (ribokinase family)